MQFSSISPAHLSAEHLSILQNTAYRSTTHHKHAALILQGKRHVLTIRSNQADDHAEQRVLRVLSSRVKFAKQPKGP